MLKLNSNSRSVKFALLAMLIILVSALLILPINGLHNKTPINNAVETADTSYDIVNGMETLSYKVNVDVKNNNIYHISETIEVDFKQGYSKHGIIRAIPYEGTIYRTDADGSKTETFERAVIKNIKVDGYDFNVSIDTSDNSKEKVIQIGNADTYVTGRKIYNITYEFVRPNDTFDGYDEFYLNIMPVNWETRIQNFSFNIAFNKDADFSKIKFYTGSNEKAINSLNITDNAISAQNINDIGYKKGLAVRIELPDNFFNKNFERYIIAGVLLGIAVLLMIAMILIRFLKFKKEDVIPIITFNPPKSMTSADIGYVLDGIVDNKDLISLLIYWANKDIIKIVESSSEDTSFIKMRELPSSAESYEVTMFNKIFESGDKVELSSLQYNFAPTLKSAKGQLKASFSTQAKKLYTPSSVNYRYLALVLCAICMIGFLGYVIYNTYIFSLLGVVVGSLICGIINICSIYFFFNGLKTVKHNKAVGMSYIGGGIAVFSILNLLVGFFMIAMAEILDLYIFYLVMELVFIVAVYFIEDSLMMTKYCLEMRGEIYGLKDFIEKTEKDRIEKLVEEDPKYFYNVLPYAYAMDVTDDWCKKFESLALEPPSWYVGNNMSTFNTILFMSIINRQMRNFNSAMSAPKPNKSGGGGKFSGLGGGGSFGGGFSGGGGFGGGGGGSW